MKKVLFLLFATVLMVACTETYEDKRDNYIDFFKSATEDINEAETMKDLLEIFKDLKKDTEEMDKKMTSEEQAKIVQDPEFQKVQAEFIRACSEAGDRCARNSIENGEDPTEYLQELQEYM